MGLSEIQNSKPIKNHVLDTTTNVAPLESGKKSDIENDAHALKSDSIKKSEEAIKTNDDKINRVAELLDSYLRSLQKDIKIQVNNKTGDIMVKVISEENGKVIREIPSKELLELAAKIEEFSGAIFSQVV